MLRKFLTAAVLFASITYTLAGCADSAANCEDTFRAHMRGEVAVEKAVEACKGLPEDERNDIMLRVAQDEISRKVSGQ